MKHGDKVYYHPRHHVKKKATWLCWIIRGKERVAVIKVERGHKFTEVAPSDVEIGRVNDGTKI
ncbi:hypothetical protein ACLOEZ_10405 [Levilactobacillus brevis]|uniref:hypothetical protein n=1 Tax=Levilactobacillus brevis TaxID=1580 RepID=UPI003EB7C80C